MVELFQPFLIMLHIFIADLRAKIDLGDTELYRFFHNVLVHPRTAVEYERNIRKFADSLQDLEMDLRFSTVITVRVTDADRKSVR